MPDYAVSTAFTAKDQGIIDAYERMGRSADQYGDRASRAFSKVSESADHASHSMRNATKHGYNFGAIVKGIVAANMIHGAVGLVGGAIKNTTKEYLHFDDEISQAVAKFSDLGPNVKGFEGHVVSLGKAVRKVGVESKFPLEQLAGGVNQIARSKIFGSAQAIEALVPLMHLNIDAQEDFAESTKNIMGMVGAWALKTDNASETMANYKEMVNLVSVANNNALVSVSDLAETMKTVGPAARSMGYGIKEVTAMTTFLARAGIKGTEASTALRNIFVHLARPDFVQDLANLKIPIVDQAGKFRPLKDFFVDLDGFIKKLQPAKAKAFLDILFGMRGSAGGNDILRQLGEFGTLMDEILHADGKMDEMAARLNDTKLNRVERFKNKLTDKTWQIFDRYADNFADGINKMMVAVDRFNMAPVIQFLSATGDVLGLVYKILSPFAGLLPWFAAGWVGVTGALKLFGAIAGTGVFEAFVSSMVIGEGPVLAMAAALGTLRIALNGLTASVPILAALGLYSAGKSLFTGKDNMFSEGFQNLFPSMRLTHDSEGHVTGRESDNQPVSVRNQQKGEVTVRFENAPPGTQVTTSSPSGSGGLILRREILGWN